MYSILNTLSNIARSVQKDEYVKVDKITTSRQSVYWNQGFAQLKNFVESNLRLWKYCVQIRCMEWFLWWASWLSTWDAMLPADPPVRCRTGIIRGGFAFFCLLAKIWGHFFDLLGQTQKTISF